MTKPPPQFLIKFVKVCIGYRWQGLVAGGHRGLCEERLAQPSPSSSPLALSQKLVGLLCKYIKEMPKCHTGRNHEGRKSFRNSHENTQVSEEGWRAGISLHLMEDPVLEVSCQETWLFPSRNCEGPTLEKSKTHRNLLLNACACMFY